MTAHIQKLLSSLHRLKPVRPNEWVACCPAHPDKNPSLAIKLCDSDGKILIKCWAGCTADEIVGSVGMDLADLFPVTTDRWGKPVRAKDREYFNPRTVLESLLSEASVIALASQDSFNDVLVPTQAYADRVELAHNRISQAMQYFN
jgi:hypothetical protein